MISPHTIYIHVTKGCNLRCIYCYFDASKRLKNELSTSEIYELLIDICQMRPRRVVFTGGEPLTREDILLLPQFLRQYCRQQMQLCITTNGTLINRENANRIVEEFDEIRISIDGFREVNDRLRGTGTFDMVMEAFRYVKEAGGQPIAMITANKVNLPVLKDFMLFLLNNGISRIHISSISLIGRAQEDRGLWCHVEEVERITSEFWYETFGLQLIRSEKRETSNCGIGNYITVYPDGSVYPCHLLSFPELCVGNVREKSFYSIVYESSLLDRLRMLDFRKFSSCSECSRRVLRENTCLGRYVQDGDRKKELLEFLGK